LKLEVATLRIIIDGATTTLENGMIALRKSHRANEPYECQDTLGSQNYTSSSGTNFIAGEEVMAGGEAKVVLQYKKVEPMVE
jgi:hypothetical protein